MDSVEEAEIKLAARCVAEALELFDAAEAVGADRDRCAAGRWTAYMLLGEFEAAWRESDAIRERGGSDPHRFWQGEALAGQHVMVRCLHGFGDAVQFLRYLPRLRALAASVVVEVAPKLIVLAGMFEGVDRVITWGEQAPSEPVKWTVQVEVMELPYVFRTEVHELPIATKYLRVPRTGAQAAVRLRVGVIGDAGGWNASRSAPGDLMRALVGMGGCEFWDLRGSGESEELQGLRVDPLCRASIEGLAGRIAALDLVITVDTLAAHLAGAMGVEAWLMLQFEGDWRWMHGRIDSPWYPTLRLFRQHKAGDWGSVERDVMEALRLKVDAAGRERDAA